MAALTCGFVVFGAGSIEFISEIVCSENVLVPFFDIFFVGSTETLKNSQFHVSQMTQAFSVYVCVCVCVWLFPIQPIGLSLVKSSTYTDFISSTSHALSGPKGR